MRHLILSVILTVLLAFAAPVLAQQSDEIDYARWEEQATQTESLLDSGTASESQLNELRAQVIDWRNQFQNGQNANAGRIATVKDQISALGPAPAEGEAEDSDIADRRKALNEQLNTLQAPRLAAVEAFSRADALVKDIDDSLAQQQADRLAQVSPSPLLPGNWSDVAGDGTRLVRGIADEVVAIGSAEGGWQQLRTKMPTVLGYLGLALVLLTFGRRWIEQLPSKLSARTSEDSRAVVAFFVSLGQIIVPMLGIFLFIRALAEAGLFGDWTRPFLLALPMAGVILFSGRWLARQLFPREPLAYSTVDIPEKHRNVARNSANLLAVVYAIHHIVAAALLTDAGPYRAVNNAADPVPLEFAEGTVSAINFVLIVLAAILLFRLGNVLRKARRWAHDGDHRLRIRVTAAEGALSRLMALGCVLLAAAGMIALSTALIWPWILTISLTGFLVLLQDLTADIFGMLKRGEEGAREGLAPLVIGMLLVVVSLPLFLLIWGASPANLAEMWTQIEQGVTVGGINLSPGGILTFIIVFAIGYSATRALQGAMRNSFLPKTKLDPGGQNAIVAGIGYIGIFLAAVIAITSAGVDLSSIAIVAGALSVGIGFGLQNIVSNFVSGIILLVERPISVGDWVDAGGQQGIVKRISVRSTQVETFDKTEVIVPNSDLVSQPVTNWTRSSRNGRVIIPVGVAYGTDTRKVEKILTEIIEDQPTVMIDPPPVVLFRSLGADSLDFEIRAILSDVSGGIVVTSDVLHEVVRRFTEEGIEIPYAQRDIWLRNPEALTGKRAPEASEASDQTRIDEGGEPAAPQSTRRADPQLTFDGEAGSGDGDGDD